MKRALELGEWRFRASREPQLGGHLFDASSHTPDALVVAFDDDHAVANAGLALTATLTERLGVEAVVDELVDLGDRPGNHRPDLPANLTARVPVAEPTTPAATGRDGTWRGCYRAGSRDHRPATTAANSRCLC
jgi:hypothetical protein